MLQLVAKLSQVKKYKLMKKKSKLMTNKVIKPNKLFKIMKLTKMLMLKVKLSKPPKQLSLMSLLSIFKWKLLSSLRKKSFWFMTAKKKIGSWAISMMLMSMYLKMPPFLLQIQQYTKLMSFMPFQLEASNLAKAQVSATVSGFS